MVRRLVPSKGVVDHGGGDVVEPLGRQDLVETMPRQLLCRVCCSATAGAPVLVKGALPSLRLLAPRLGHRPARLDRDVDRHGACPLDALCAHIVFAHRVFGARDFGATLLRNLLALATRHL